LAFRVQERSRLYGRESGKNAGKKVILIPQEKQERSKIVNKNTIIIKRNIYLGRAG